MQIFTTLQGLGALCKIVTVACALVIATSVRDMGLCDDDWDENDGYYSWDENRTWVEWEDDYCHIHYDVIETSFTCFAVMFICMLCCSCAGAYSGYAAIQPEANNPAHQRGAQIAPGQVMAGQGMGQGGQQMVFVTTGNAAQMQAGQMQTGQMLIAGQTGQPPLAFVQPQPGQINMVPLQGQGAQPTPTVVTAVAQGSGSTAQVVIPQATAVAMIPPGKQG